MRKVLRSVFLVCVSAVAATVAPAASQNETSRRTISIRFPDHTDVAGLSINYFMNGPFGGYGGFVRTDPAVREYSIDLLHEGRAATAFKAFIYNQGYGFHLLHETALPEGRIDPFFIQLKPLGSIPLSGRLTGVSSSRGLTIEARYVADWECEFFNLIDCLQGSIPVARSTVAADGTFTIGVPDFWNDPVVKSYRQYGRFVFALSGRGTDNLRVQVVTEDPRRSVPVASEYVQNVELRAVIH